MWMLPLSQLLGRLTITGFMVYEVVTPRPNNNTCTHTHTLTVDTQVGSMCVICVATIIQLTMVKSKVLQLYFREVQLGTIYFFRFGIFL